MKISFRTPILAGLVLLVALLYTPRAHSQTDQGASNFPQINSTLYIGSLKGGQIYPTIQSGVTKACTAGSRRVVDIPTAYAGSDLISGVTGGCVNTRIEDERTLPKACYTWSGSAYTSTACYPGTGSGISTVAIATSNGFQGSSSGGSNPILTINVDGTHYLPTTSDQTNWNAKQAAGNYITDLTGDVAASGPGSAAATLATVNSNVGSCGDATHVAQVTLDAKGRATACTAIAITGAGGFPITLGSTSIAASSTTTTIAGLTLTSPVFTGPALGTPISGIGSNLTALNATQLTSGTVPTARLTQATNAAMGIMEGDGSTLTCVAGVCSSLTGGAGTVTTTGSPASGNLAKFSGATAITNGDLSGDVTTSGTLVTAVVKVNGAALPTSTAVVGTNSSGQIIAVPAQAANTVYGNFTGSSAVPGFSASPTFAVTNLTGTGAFSTSGNAGTATILQTTRTINGTNFNGSANITITAAPSGTAGGSLAGSYPNPTIAGIGSTANVFAMSDGAGHLTTDPRYFTDADTFLNFNVPGINIVTNSSGVGSQLPGIYFQNNACPGSPVEVSANVELASSSSENALVVGHQNACQPSGLASAADISFITQTGYAHHVPGTSIYSVTNSSLTSNVVTLTSANSLSAGQFVLVFNLTSATLGPLLNNKVFTVLAATGTQFTFAFTNANVGSAAESGNAQQMVDNQLDITNQGGGIINLGFTGHTPFLSIRTGLATNGVFLPTLTSQTCLGTDSTGLIGAGTCSGSTGISGATYGQVLIAGSATTATSSKALAGAGAGIVTGPTSATATDIAIYTSTTGGLVDSGVPIGSIPTLSGANNFTGASGFQGAANSGPLSVSNITAATSGANQSSPCFGFVAQYWTGSISAGDNWSICNVLGAGTNPTSTLTFGHIGSSGSATVALPALSLSAPLPAASGGFGISTSASTGYPSVATGTWSVATASTTFSTLYKTVATSLGDIVYGIATGTPTRLAGPTTNGLYTLTENPIASAAVAPAFTLLAASATTDATNATNISTGTMAAARLPAALANSTSINGTNIPASSTLGLHIANGTSTLGTSPIGSATCATVVTTTATGTATTDTVGWGFNGDPTAVTGYIPATSGMLTIIAYPSSGNVNFKVCNNTASSITPGSALTLNWTVIR